MQEKEARKDELDERRGGFTSKISLISSGLLDWSTTLTRLVPFYNPSLLPPPPALHLLLPSFPPSPLRLISPQAHGIVNPSAYPPGAFADVLKPKLCPAVSSNGYPLLKFSTCSHVAGCTVRGPALPTTAAPAPRPTLDVRSSFCPTALKSLRASSS
eukprot:724253-Hanusia_phi.AAC.2